jgi:hypothetical protein
MHIKQWLQEPLQKRQCEMIIDETLWELAQQGVKVPKNVENFYEQLLCYNFDEDLEFLFYQYLQILQSTKISISESMQVFGVESPTIQDMMQADGTIKKGFAPDIARSVFRVLQSLVREKYAVI